MYELFQRTRLIFFRLTREPFQVNCQINNENFIYSQKLLQISNFLVWTPIISQTSLLINIVHLSAVSFINLPSRLVILASQSNFHMLQQQNMLFFVTFRITSVMERVEHLLRYIRNRQKIKLTSLNFNHTTGSDLLQQFLSRDTL